MHRTQMLLIGFLVDDVYKFSDALLAAGVPFHKVCRALLITPDMYVFCVSALNWVLPPHQKPDDGGMKGLAFALDPDGYRVEIIRRGGMKSVAPKCDE